MARNSTQLFVTVGGNVDGLKQAGRAVALILDELKKGELDFQAVSKKVFSDLGTDSFVKTANQIEGEFRRTLNKFKADAEAQVGASTPQAAINLLDTSAYEQRAAALRNNAATLNLVAEASLRAKGATEAETQALQTRAAIAAGAAESNLREADALDNEIRARRAVTAEIGRSNQASGALVVAGNRNTVSAGQQRLAFQQLGFQINDIAGGFASGQKPVIIFSQQLSQVTQALSLMTNSSKGFLGFLGGPWGIGIGAAAVVLAPFVLRLLEGNSALDDAVDKLKKDAESTDLSRRAHEAFAKTIEGQIDAQRRLNEQLDRQAQTQRQLQIGTLAQARKSVADQETSRPGLLNQIREQARIADSFRRQLAKPEQQDPEALPGIAILSRDADAKLTALREKLARLDQSIIAGQRGIREAQIPLIQSDVESQFNANAAAALRYMKALGNLNAALQIGAGKKGYANEYQADGSTKRSLVTGISPAEYRRQLDLITRQRDEAIKAASAAGPRANRQSGREIDVEQARAIVAAIGGRVTSGYRSNEEQRRIYADKLAGRHDGPVAKPGTSAHERGNAIDIAFGPGISLAKIVAAFEAEGVAIRKKLIERGQKVYHIEFGKAGPSAETLTKRQEAEAKRGRADQDKAGDLLAAARIRQASAEAEIANSAEARLQFELGRIDDAKSDRDREIDLAALDNRFIAANLEKLKAANATASDLEKQIVTRRHAQQVEEDAVARARASDNDAVTLLQIQERIAATQSEREDIERRILAIKQRQEREELQRIIDNKTGRYSATDIPIAQDQQKRLPAKQQAEQQDLGRQQGGPIAQYKQQLQRNVGDINTALGDVGANGLRSLEDGLLGVINGTKSVADAFKDMAASIISDIARILIERALLSFLGLGDGGLVGGILGFADGGKVPGFAGGGLPGFAGGSHPFTSNGMIHGRGTGRSDSILALVNQKVPIMVSNGEAIVNERGVKKHWPLIDAINHDRLGPISGFADGGLVDPAQIRLRPLPSSASIAPRAAAGGGIVFDLRGAVMTEDLLRQMNAISARHAEVAVIGGSRQAQRDLHNRELMKIPT